MSFEIAQYPARAIHVSLDLETASLEPNAAIVQIGATLVENTAGVVLPNYECYMSVMSNEMVGRDVSTSTMDWWNEQDPILRKRVFGGTLSLENGINGFIDWCSYVSRDDLDRIVLWSKPAQFDIPILKSAVEIFREWPFHYQHTGCAATVMRIMAPSAQEECHEEAMQMIPDFQAHNALHDAQYQARFIRRVL